MSKLIEKVIKNCDDKDRVVKKELECAEQAYVEDKIEHILRNFKDDVSDSKNIIKDLNRQLKDANKELKCMKNEYKSFLDLSDKEVREFILTENCSTTGPSATLSIRILGYLRHAEYHTRAHNIMSRGECQLVDNQIPILKIPPVRYDQLKALEANPKYSEIFRYNKEVDDMLKRAFDYLPKYMPGDYAGQNTDNN